MDVTLSKLTSLRLRLKKHFKKVHKDVGDVHVDVSLSQFGCRMTVYLWSGNSKIMAYTSKIITKSTQELFNHAVQSGGIKDKLRFWDEQQAQEVRNGGTSTSVYIPF